MLGTRLPVEALDDVLHFLSATAIRDQKSVVGIDHEQVFDAEGVDQVTVAPYVAAHRFVSMDRTALLGLQFRAT